MSFCLILPVVTGLGPSWFFHSPLGASKWKHCGAGTQMWKDINLLGVHRPPLPSRLNTSHLYFRTFIVLKPKCKEGK